MVIAQSTIDFLGLTIQSEKMCLQPHIVSNFQKCSDGPFTVKQLQQFLGLVNYMKDFVPHIAQYRAELSQLLRKDPPLWGLIHTETIKKLKRISASLAPLQIPSNKGTHILQTDASDNFWRVVLLEEIDKGRTICGYQSGMFKPSEQHYHSTFKEILAVKRAIEKFQFHIVGRHFLVEMDMSAFPAMLQRKNTILPQPQLIRWKNWFSQWHFEVKHIAGKKNFLADFLSRPHEFQPDSSPQILPILMLAPSDPGPSHPVSSPFPCHQLPLHLKEIILRSWFSAQAICHSFVCISKYRFGSTTGFSPTIIHPSYPFFTIFDLTDPTLSPLKYGYCWLKSLIKICTIGCLFDKRAALHFINLALTDRLLPWDRESYFPLWLSLFSHLSN